MNIRFRLNELLDVVQMSVEAVIMSPIIIGCLIERFFEWLGEIADDAVWAHENYEKLEFELREAKNDAWAANLVLKDANEGWRKERIRRCRLLYEYCKLRWENEGRKRTLFWLKWQDRWLELERYYKEFDLNGEKNEQVGRYRCIEKPAAVRPQHRQPCEALVNESRQKPTVTRKKKDS